MPHMQRPICFREPPFRPPTAITAYYASNQKYGACSAFGTASVYSPLTGQGVEEWWPWYIGWKVENLVGGCFQRALDQTGSLLHRETAVTQGYSRRSCHISLPPTRTSAFSKGGTCHMAATMTAECMLYI